MRRMAKFLAKRTIPSASIVDGEIYYADHINACQFGAMNAAEILSVEEEKRPACDDPTGPILLVRPGGFGDLLQLTVTVKEIRRVSPERPVTISAFSRFHPVLSGCGAEAISYPVHQDDWERHDGVVTFDGMIEADEVGKTMHMADLFLLECGFDPETVQDKRPFYRVTDDEAAEAREVLERSGHDDLKFYAVQDEASALCRTYPHTPEVARMLWQGGALVAILGGPDNGPENEPERMINCPRRNMTFREQAALVSMCGGLIAPDSAWIHMAQALDIPALGIYGPFPWDLRTRYAPKTFCLQGNGRCAPCFFHQCGQFHWPESGPCALTGRCEVLAGIRPEDVVRRFRKLMGEI